MNKRGIYAWWVVGIVCGLFCLFFLTVAVAAYVKAQDMIVVRNGFFEDYMKLSVVSSVLGLVFGGVSVFGLTRRRKLPPPADEHF